MNIAEFSIRRKTTTLILTSLIVVGSIFSYYHLGRLEDPEFTIKDALIITPYPGASAKEVEKEVSSIIEKAVQELGQLEEVTSKSQQGLSIVTVSIEEKYDKHSLPQIWDLLRRKVNDAQQYLPPGAGPSMVNDDFGDVYGVFLAITGDVYTYQELKQVAKYLQRELLLVQDVSKVMLYGEFPERIYIETSRDKMAQFGIAPQAVYQALSARNIVVNAGKIQVGREYIAFRPTGQFESVEEIEQLLIGQALHGIPLPASENRVLRLGDIATVERGYQEPPDTIFRVNGQPAIGLAISTVQGGNVVKMGEALTARLDELLPKIPFGFQVHKIAVQSETVTEAISGFVISLIEAVLIVIAVLMLTMGLRSGVLIGIVLIVTICGTLIVMDAYGIMMERVSLGALIIALGMLVDNAIVITEGLMVRIQRGEDKLKAAKAVVGQNALPLLGATFVTVFAFAAIGLSEDSTGEYCRSLFQVILISLLLSWVTAVTITPLFCTMAFHPKPGASLDSDPYNSRFFLVYKRFLTFCLRRKWLVIGGMIGLLVISIIGFAAVEQSFFPDSTRAQFQIDLWMPEGTHITQTAKRVEKIEEYLSTLDHVSGVASFTGQGAPRFLLTYAPQLPNDSYAYILISVDDYKQIDSLKQDVQQYLDTHFPETVPLVYQFMLGTGETEKIQLRFSGPDTATLRELAEKAMDVLHEEPDLMGIQTDWRGIVKAYRPVLAEAPARNHGVEPSAIATVLQQAFDGTMVGVFRENEELIPIVSRPPKEERKGTGDLQNLYIWSSAAMKNIPLKQVVSGYEVVFEDSIVKRIDRKRTITVKCTPRTGNANAILTSIMPKIEAIELPPDYKLEWGGEYEESRKAQAGLLKSLPIFVLLMVLIVIVLFDAVRQPLIIWLCVPLAIIGVTAGLLITSQPFGFMALLGFLSLSGMLIKNAIVLIDQINLEIREGKDPFPAIVDSGVSRMRPVLMAAVTTVMGMIPLLFDAFFVSMAVTIIFGLTFASILTLVVVPVLYVLVFRVKVPKLV